jgi:hypothetical protein
MITHFQVESALRRLVPTQIGCEFGHIVWRRDQRHWSIDGGEPVSLLVAVDCLMKRHLPCGTMRRHHPATGEAGHRVPFTDA